jgi:N4-gp56 family major capsid protein
MANQMNIAGSTTGDMVQLTNVVLDVYSQEILFEAQPQLRFEAICVKRTELGTMPGNKIKFLKYNALSGKPAIAETAQIETDTISTSTLEIAVTEHAKALSFSEFLLRSAMTNTLQDAAVLLGQHYAKFRDSLVRDALLTGSNVLFADPDNTTSRAQLTAAHKFDVELIRAAVEQLAVNKAPKIDGDAYFCFIHPHQARYLRKDPAWVNVNLYASPDSIKAGEIGRIEDVRFIETTQVPLIKKSTQDVWADNEDTGDNTVIAANTVTDVYRAILVGDYAVGLAEGLPVEMRDDGIHDFGRQRKLAYYGIWGAGLIEEGHSLILETA